MTDRAPRLRAISLWQPWAAAIAVGLKRVETRSWQTPGVGPLAIHAAKRWGPDQRAAARRLGAMLGDEDAFLREGPRNFRGGIVALVELVGCEEMTPEMIDRVEPEERTCGDWRPGRFAWRLARIRPLVDPYPLRGRQGIWRLSALEEDSVRLLAGDELGLFRPRGPLIARANCEEE